MTIEYRTATGGASASGGKLTGLVTPFGTETTIGDLKRGGFREKIAPGAFKKTLQERDVVLLFNHNTDMPLARTSVSSGPGSLALREDPAAGLRADSEPVQTSYGQDLMALTRSGVVKGMSFGFEVVKDAWTDDEGRSADPSVGTHRTIQEVKLHEVSAVTFPAYQTTTLSARDAINAARGSEFERHAQDVWNERADADGNPKPYGDVKYADPKNGKYPIDTEAHAKAAWAYINVAKNAAQYPMNGVTLSEVKDAIKAALKHFGVTVSEENAVDLALEWRSLADGYQVDLRDAVGAIAATDAVLDEVKPLIEALDRNSLPPEVNQIFDLICAAGIAAGKASELNGVPDPDKPNGNEYQEDSADPEGETRDEADPEAERIRLEYYKRMKSVALDIQI